MKRSVIGKRLSCRFYSFSPTDSAEEANILGLTFAVGVELAEPERPTITSVTHGQMVTTVNFIGLTGEEYVLLKSLDLEFENPSTVAQVTLDSDTGSMMDDAAFEEEAFYRITTVQ